ncbi:lipopolysaccharide transport periplasmic protein LptA [Acidihalobacter ferrooxydans]|uniref:Lipopolysaccharide transport periplasmic protein LptA n=1 Tax=Acidihalobacter ferrooxydans TaxID=1765967 RepID=A0A1P8UJF3_9GAMM|nr:lipopolysaccharide transport periplasmic protein LptA [Acidihalobacter ferrooxydans]APZ43934.1 lipopolysaccharide transport periplasmic protein LptA [Acidihalobacter ferrooxydans]
MPIIRYCLASCTAALLFAAPTWAATNTLAASRAPVHISADHFRFDQPKGIGNYSGNVIVTQAKLIIKGAKLTILAPQNGTLKKLTMTGNLAAFQDVTTTGKAVSGQALRMEYDPAKQQIVLLGKARVEQSGNTFRAARIVYDIRHDLVDAGAPGQRIEATFKPASATTGTAHKP